MVDASGTIAIFDVRIMGQITNRLDLCHQIMVVGIDTISHLIILVKFKSYMIDFLMLALVAPNQSISFFDAKYYLIILINGRTKLKFNNFFLEDFPAISFFRYTLKFFVNLVEDI
jgi:hypothetical protein